MTMCKEANFSVSYLISKSHFQYFTVVMRINSKGFEVRIFNKFILYGYTWLCGVYGSMAMVVNSFIVDN